MTFYRIAVFSFLTLFLVSPIRAGTVIVMRSDSSQLNFAYARLKLALSQIGKKPVRKKLDSLGRNTDIVILTGPAVKTSMNPLNEKLSKVPLPKANGYNIFRIQPREKDQHVLICVSAPDETGAMYGMLDLAEQIRMIGELEKVSEKQSNPRFAFRAIKFNLPWMSYRKSEALSLHTETCRDLKFWEAFLDMMAGNRFNVLSLWNLHPFHYMIRPKNFPEASPFSDEEMMTWRTFWKSLFRMAKERGIETYIVNWNIFVSPSFAKAHNLAKYSIKWKYYGKGDFSELVQRYNRECVTQVINEYEDLTGLGISLGERMHGVSSKKRQEWIVETYFKGIKQANRPVKFIHRAPFTIDPAVTRNAIEQFDFPITPVWVEMKFNWSHGHSSPRLCITHGGKVGRGYWEPIPKNYKMAWMIRNEDFFLLRWGQPDFIREHIKINGGPHAGGYFVGSECYIPAKDYMQKPGKHVNWKYAFQRQWLFYMQWGRLLYDPQTPDEIFAAEFERRFGPGTGEAFVSAFALASRMPLRLASFMNFTWDFTLYSEGFLAPVLKGRRDGRSPFISVNENIQNKTLDPAFMSVGNYVNAVIKKETIKTELLTPLELADELEKDGRAALKLVETLGLSNGPNVKTRRCEMADIKAWSFLSLYFADKLRGGVALELFRRTEVETEQNNAIALLEKAAKHWAKLVETTEPYYEEVPVVHLKKKKFSWAAFTSEVKRDIEIARAGKRKK